MTKPIRLSFRGAVVTRYVRPDPMPCFDMETYWLGFGYLGTVSPSMVKTPPKFRRRRYLQARSSLGQIQYFNWTEPYRGDTVIRVMGFTKVKKITKEEAKKHFRKIV